MSRLPLLSGRRAVSAFRQAGFEVRRQHGSHIVMTKPGSPRLSPCQTTGSFDPDAPYPPGLA